MISAFGVDHGEISKGRWIRPARGRPGGRRPTRAQQRTQGTNPDAVGRPQKVKDALNRVGETPISIKGVGGAAGRGASNVGGFFQSHPGLTGTALVAGGGAGTYGVLREKKKPR